MSLDSEESDTDSLSSTSSASSFDEEAANRRIKPDWCAFRHIIESRGFRLDTFRDVKQYYQHYCESLGSLDPETAHELPGYARARRGLDDNDLCKDLGLPENLFRGTRCSDGMKVVIKAVHLQSHELEIVRYLSSPPLRNHPMNHCIPVLDLIQVPKDDIAFVVMEEWAPQHVAGVPCNLRIFLGSLRQCLEHTVFMHNLRLAHLDISTRNLLTDCEGHYAWIDFELSLRFDGSTARIRGRRGTELSPELERGESSDPFKVDVWALGIFMLRACQLSGFCVPEVFELVKPMLREDFEQRPTAQEVLAAFDNMVHTLDEHKLQMPSSHSR
ncbi:kinase-like protein [Obba rivulosa]|uniref:Kinase-like protein n=1 Tax=Obba rivulosa TaxID=1052685 RepID=A0A8E2DSG7_9APHY|nr:kinase-like protein [Obba rivulosa]